MEHNFEFAFNSSNFSDRVLQIEIVAGRAEGKADWHGGESFRHRKRRREDINFIKKEEGLELETDIIDISLNCKPPGAEDAADDENDEEAVVKIEQSISGDDHGPHGSDSLNVGSSPVIGVKSIYVSSAILAANSPFFYKLFSNGMRESDQRHATLRINESEEAALMELLSFMYSGRLSTTCASLLLDVLVAADKYEVASCMRYCCQLLRSLPMSKESALRYLELPSSVSIASAVKSLTDVAKKFLADNFKDLTKPQEGLIELPLVGIEAILSSDELQVTSEDAVYDFVQKWARRHYPNNEERRAILGSSLVHLIRFPFMTCRKLKKVLAHSDMDQEIVSKVVLEALFFKADSSFRRASASGDPKNHKFVERAYKYRPVKVVEFELPCPQCIVYLDLKREECVNLFPAGRVYSQAFHLGGQGFFLSAHCNTDQQSSFHCFGLFLGMQEKGSLSFTVDYEFSVRTRSSGDFVSKYKGNYTFTGGKAVGYRNLFGVTWTSLMADDSLYFINGVLHLRAELTVKQVPSPPQQQQLH